MHYWEGICGTDEILCTLSGGNKYRRVVLVPTSSIEQIGTRYAASICCCEGRKMNQAHNTIGAQHDRRRSDPNQVLSASNLESYVIMNCRPDKQQPPIPTAIYFVLPATVKSR